MPKKGEKIRGRTVAEQAIYDRVIGRLMSGESVKAISEEIGVSAGKLYQWKSLEIKRARKRANGLDVVLADETTGEIISVSPGVEVVSPKSENSSPDIEAVSPNQEVRENSMRSEGLKTSLLEGAQAGLVSLETLRPEALEGLKLASGSITKLLSHLHDDIEAGQTSVWARTQDGIISETIPMGVPLLKDAGVAVKALTQELAALHCLTHGAITTRALDFTPAVPSQHLHLHSAAGVASTPEAAIKSYSPGLPAPESEPAYVDVIDCDQREKLKRL